MDSSQTARDLYKTLWILAQVTFWLAVLAGLYTLQAGRWLRAYYQAEWAATGQNILTDPDCCREPSMALTGTTDTLYESPAKRPETMPPPVSGRLHRDRTATARLRALMKLLGRGSRSWQAPAQSQQT